MSPDPRTTQPRRDQVVEIRRETSVEEHRPRLELSLSKILAGALAAASAAVAASWLGVAGTVLGAVLASVVVSVGTALYHRPLERSTEVFRQTLPLATDRYRSLDAGTETMVLDPRDEPTPAPAEQTATATVQSGIPPRPAKRRVQWGTVAVSSALTLVVGFGLLSAVEGILGHSVSGDGGSTLSRIVQRDSGNGGDRTPTTPDTTKDEPTQPAPTDPTTTEPTDPAPTEPTDPTPTEPTPTEPTPTEPTPTEPTTTDPTADGTTTNGTSTDAPPTDGGATTLGSTTL